MGEGPNCMRVRGPAVGYCGILWEFVGSCWILLDLVGSCGSLWDLVGSCLQETGGRHFSAEAVTLAVSKPSRGVCVDASGVDTSLESPVGWSRWHGVA